MAKSAEDRVALALAELERTGAYDRSLLIVGSPAGTGVVNSVAFETADYLLRGDSAGVAVQYERLPSLLCLHRTGVGGHHHRLVARRAFATRWPADRATATAASRGGVRREPRRVGRARTRSCTGASKGSTSWVSTTRCGSVRPSTAVGSTTRWRATRHGTASFARCRRCCRCGRPPTARARPRPRRVAQSSQRPDPQDQPRSVRAPPDVARGPAPADGAAAPTLHTGDHRAADHRRHRQRHQPGGRRVPRDGPRLPAGPPGRRDGGLSPAAAHTRAVGTGDDGARRPTRRPARCSSSCPRSKSSRRPRPRPCPLAELRARAATTRSTRPARPPRCVHPRRRRR